MKIWMLRCDEVSKRVSESMDRELGFFEKMFVRFHLMMCHYCSEFRHQLNIIREIVRHHDIEVREAKMSSAARDKIQKIVNDTLQNDRSV